MERSAGRISLSRTQRGLIAVVVSGAVVIAAIGFAGSYTAVRDLAVRKGFGSFATVFPIGVDAGIAVLLALDLLLTWLRIPFPMLRQAAWLLTAATIGFNAVAAWPDPVGVGMHGVIPILFVVTVEAARHAVGRLAAITADRHMEGVRLWRWLLAPLPTFRLWRRMMLWEIRKYDDVIQAEQQRLVYQARLRGRYGRGWRWKAPVEELLPLRIARFGVPLEAASHPRVRDPEAGTSRPQELDKRNGPGSGDQNDHAVGPEHAGGFELPDAGSSEPDASRDEQDPIGGVAAEAPPEPGPPASAAPASRQKDSEAEPGWSTPGPGDPAGDEEPGDEPTDVPIAGRADEEPTVPTLGEGGVPKAADPVPEIEGGAAAGNLERAEHESAVAGLKSNAAAVRYAMRVLDSTHTPTVVDWLAAHGREVNRGQAHRITRDEEERLQGAQRLAVVKGAS
ncbi:DUF2637 domain-containing protein [Streptomyces sp. NPDC059802]|uniref:DUF2637 domain-containing protein n=1 Tax=Streptomyces sp. NPDC059802 TaxID=3346952 RepID=UPI0036633B43